MARRAASIWRAVSRSGSTAFRPCEPKFSVGAALGLAVDAALEGLAKLGALRLQHGRLSSNLAGQLRSRRRRVATIATLAAPAAAAALLRLDGALLGGHRVVLQDLALEDPDLDADDAVRGRGATP